MDGGRLHRLGKRLIELSARATGEAGDPTLTPGEAAVLADVITHPATSISELHRRTGFAQSHVSASVARLRARGLVTAATDPSDVRRTRVSIADAAARAITRRAARPIDGVIGDIVGDTARARRATELLEELADLLL